MRKQKPQKPKTPELIARVDRLERKKSSPLYLEVEPLFTDLTVMLCDVTNALGFAAAANMDGILNETTVGEKMADFEGAAEVLIADAYTKAKECLALASDIEDRVKGVRHGENT